ncbi:hypothetical protein HDC90_002639 [Pedobacter sp. AK013]|uniref:hypothetical protein n=1 Tax=Pedobacter sp. AK013 TaxID=2723071 RepID=UPI00160703CC|nr:hypothetical protein [Pedobacter sp. AK013]MBB6238011.1 hypothetical protein [Pedobacter sp. AK013]
METRFTINISLQGPGGKITYGKFSLGRDKKEANEIFSSLKGNAENVSGCSLKIEFLEEIMGLPVPIGRINCCLDELKENIAIISKEIFRIAHLENGNIDY